MDRLRRTRRSRHRFESIVLRGRTILGIGILVALSALAFATAALAFGFTCGSRGFSNGLGFRPILLWLEIFHRFRSLHRCRCLDRLGRLNRFRRSHGLGSGRSFDCRGCCRGFRPLGGSGFFRAGIGDSADARRCLGTGGRRWGGRVFFAHCSCWKRRSPPVRRASRGNTRKCGCRIRSSGYRLWCIGFRRTCWFFHPVRKTRGRSPG